MSTASASNLRLMSDLKTMKQNPPEGVSASPLGDENLHVWGGSIFGTDDTAWEGGIFSMRLTFPEQYPDKPPRIRFTSEMVRGSGSKKIRVASRCSGRRDAVAEQLAPARSLALALHTRGVACAAAGVNAVTLGLPPTPPTHAASCALLAL